MYYVCVVLFSLSVMLIFITAVGCLLTAADLPGESYEFYHFCYVSAADHRVRGVSTPFQFTSDRQNDWELLEPPLSDVTVNSVTTELEVVQQVVLWLFLNWQNIVIFNFWDSPSCFCFRFDLIFVVYLNHTCHL